jgi:metallophosphoesterase (TIGR00282 family)
MRFLFIADIVAEAGTDLALDLIPRMRALWQPDFIVINGENAHMGKGITTPLAKKFLSLGVNCITSGNHIWEPKKRDVLIDLAGEVLRPINYPAGNIGVGSNVFTVNGQKVAVINAMGLAFMYPIDNPLFALEAEVKRLRRETPFIFVDFHAEASAEKQAVAWALDGQITCLAGTHTHVQTADERILPKGTGMITDAGMTGPYDSVIGMEIEPAIARLRLQTPVYYRHASDNVRLKGILFAADSEGHCTKIVRVNVNKIEFGKLAEQRRDLLR